MPLQFLAECLLGKKFHKRQLLQHSLPTLQKILTKKFVHLSELLESISLVLNQKLENSQSSYLIKLGLHEALVNAVKHGNKLDPKKY